MKMTEVKSSNISKIGRDESTSTLNVMFKSGKTFSYLDVNKEEFESLLGAESVGKHFIQFIKAVKECKPADEVEEAGEENESLTKYSILSQDSMVKSKHGDYYKASEVDEVINHLKAEIERLKGESEWIACSDKMPEQIEGARITCYSKHEDMIFDCEFTDDCWANLCGSEFTHWMPYNPPKEQ